jgi:hypothetical protein
MFRQRECSLLGQRSIVCRNPRTAQFQKDCNDCDRGVENFGPGFAVRLRSLVICRSLLGSGRGTGGGLLQDASELFLQRRKRCQQRRRIGAADRGRARKIVDRLSLKLELKCLSVEHGRSSGLSRCVREERGEITSRTLAERAAERSRTRKLLPLCTT